MQDTFEFFGFTNIYRRLFIELGGKKDLTELNKYGGVFNTIEGNSRNKDYGCLCS